MDLRKFYLILTTIIAVLLFGGGVAIIHYMSGMGSYNAAAVGSNNPINDIFAPLAVGRDPFNVLLLVGDKSEDNTDTIMLVNYNPVKNDVSILSIPRDTRVVMEGIKFPKINSYFKRKDGKELLENALNQLLGVHVNYYVYLNIKTFREIIDLLGGVDYYVPADMYYWDPTQNLRVDLKKGQQLMDGNKAEQLLRFRKASPGHWNKDLKEVYDGSDVKRIQVQQNFIKELIRQKANILNLTKINDIIRIVYENLETDFPQNEVFKLVKNIAGFNLDHVRFFTLPGEDKMIDKVDYYIYDAEKGNSILTEYFNASPSYSYNGNSTDQNQDSGSSTKKSSSGKKNYKKNNPSNSDSSLKGSHTPAP